MGGKIGTAAKIAMILMMLGAGVAFAVAGERSPMPAPASPDGTAATARRPAVRVTGRARGLYPGKTGKVRVNVRNLDPFAIRVLRVSARVGDAAPGCPRSVLNVRALRTRLRIRPGGRIKTWLTIKMLPTAPDACQGATFPITFRTKTAAR
jgi:hypothetical protein